MRIDVLVAEPPASVFILEEFQWTGRHVAAKLRVVIHSCFVPVFHDALLFDEQNWSAQSLLILLSRMCAKRRNACLSCNKCKGIGSSPREQ